MTTEKKQPVQKRLLGRPTAVTDEQISQALNNSYGLVSIAAQNLGISVRTIYYRLAKSDHLKQVQTDAKIAAQETLLVSAMERALAGDTALTIFLLKQRWIPPKVQQILNDLKDEKISLKDAALLIESTGWPLPESIHILLAKEIPEPPDPSGGAYCVVDDAEMERRMAARQAAIDKQKENLPERRIQIDTLHNSVADTWHKQDDKIEKDTKQDIDPLKTNIETTNDMDS